MHWIGRGNMFFAASAQELSLGPVDYSDAHPEVMAQVRNCLGAIVKPDATSGRVLTDDYNPVEFYDAENREAHRRNLAFSVRKLSGRQ